MSKTYDLLGLGNALIDLIVEVDDAFFDEVGIKKGHSNLLSDEKAQEMLAKVQKRHTDLIKVPGGSAANVVSLFSALGGKGAFMGGVGKDEFGVYYDRELKKDGVVSLLAFSGKKTGYALTFVSKDAQRTFAVSLGAASDFDVVNGVGREAIISSAVVHVEGYLLADPLLRQQCVELISLAKRHRVIVSLDVSDPFVIEQNKQTIVGIMPKVGVLFANEDEAKALTGLEAERAVSVLGETVPVVVVKVGEKGSLVGEKGLVHYVPARLVQVRDTNGAGDTYAAGFLYGYVRGWDVLRCATLGTVLASLIVQQFGARSAEDTKKKMKELVVGV